MARSKDYYELLGVSRTATPEEIRKAYRKLARQYHPDVNKAPDAAERFSEIQEAYDVLSDEEKRQSYDRFGHAGVGGGAGVHPGAGWGGGAGQRGGRTVWTSEGGVSGADFTSILEEMFGGMGAGGGTPFDVGFGGRAGRTRVRPPARGQDIEQTITVTFLTAALGGTEHLRVESGGSVSTINVRIPPGIESGAKLRVRGKGAASPFGGPPGDLILTVQVGRHPYFRREGLDLYVDVPITIAEAVQGATVTVPLLPKAGTKEWRSIELKVPPGTASGRKLRVRGQGVTDSKKVTGDYYAVVQIVAPSFDELSDRGKAAIRDLASELQNPRESAPWADNERSRSA